MAGARYSCGLGMVLGISVLLLAGCDGSSSGSSGTSETIGDTGGTVEVTSGSLEGSKLEVPAGAVSSDTRFTIRSGSDVSESSTTKAGRAVRIGPSGTTFSTAATVTVPYDDSVVSNVKKLVVLKRNDDTGRVTVLLPTNVNTGSNRVSVRVNSLSTFQAGIQNLADPSEDYHLLTMSTDMSQNASVEEGAIFIYGGAGEELNFDGSGGASSTASDSDTANELTIDGENDTGSLDTFSETLNKNASSVDVFSNGQITLTTPDGDASGAISASGQILVAGFPFTETNARALDVSVGVEQGSGMANSDFSGSYHFVGIAFELSDGNGGADVDTGGFVGGFSANGAGTISWSALDEEFANLAFPLGGDVQLTTDSGMFTPGNWDYTVNSDGTISLTDDAQTSLSGAITPDGEVVVWVNNLGDGATDLGVAIKEGSSLDESDLSGSYNVFTLGSELVRQVDASGDEDRGLFTLFLSGPRVVEFDGSGDLIFGGAGEIGMQMDVLGGGSSGDTFVDLQQFSENAEADGTGTYSVASDGVLSLSVTQDGGTDILEGAMSADGDFFVLILTDNGTNEAIRDIIVGVKQP